MKEYSNVSWSFLADEEQGGNASFDRTVAESSRWDLSGAAAPSPENEVAA